MEIDIFPIPHRKEGIARNFDKGFLGILIITYIIAARYAKTRKDS